MKKVAIMTWWHYSNYGTALQVTALYHVVTKMGYKVDVIDYIPHGRVVKQENLKALIKFMKKFVLQSTFHTRMMS